MGLRDSYKMDKAVETNGVWETMGYNADNSPIEFLLARRGGGNEAYSKRIEELTRPHRAAIQSGKLPGKLAVKINQQCFAETVIKDWRGVQQGEFDGTDSTKIVKFTSEKAIELFDLMPDLYEDANTRASNSAKYAETRREDDVKN